MMMGHGKAVDKGSCHREVVGSQATGAGPCFHAAYWAKISRSSRTGNATVPGRQRYSTGVF
jgi:hypothetical protein